MEKSETVSDFASRKSVRQLDFTAIGGSGNRVNAEIPPQKQKSILLQKSISPSELKNEAKLKTTQVCSPSQSRSHLQSPAKSPWSTTHTQQQATPKSQVNSKSKLASPVTRIPHPVQKISTTALQFLKQESPSKRPWRNMESKDSTPKKKRQCNCKNSKCLKLYCECFAAGILCDGCNCSNCNNNVDHETATREARQTILQRNPNAFKPKIVSSPQGPRGSKEEAEIQVLGKHNKGCYCKKTGCLKKYCECFQANVFCSENCRCVDCKNFEGSEERSALDSVNLKQAANVAITQAIGSSGNVMDITPKKRKLEEIEEIYSGKASIDQDVLTTQSQRENDPVVEAPGPGRSVSVAPDIANVTSPVSSRSTYRSPLAHALEPQDVEHLCSLLVVLSGLAAKSYAESRGSEDQQMETKKFESSVASSAEILQKKKEVHEPLFDGHAEKNVAKRNGTHDSGSDGVDIQNNGRPLSPETLALMCDEQDEMFLSNSSANAMARNDEKIIHKTSNPDVCKDNYKEQQERLVLTEFRDFLLELCTRGSIEEEMCSPLANKEVRNKQEAGDNGNIETDLRNENGKGLHMHSDSIANSHTPFASEVSDTSSAMPNGQDNDDLSLRIGLPTGTDGST